MAFPKAPKRCRVCPKITFLFHNGAHFVQNFHSNGEPKDPPCPRQHSCRFLHPNDPDWDLHASEHSSPRRSSFNSRHDPPMRYGARSPSPPRRPHKHVSRSKERRDHWREREREPRAHENGSRRSDSRDEGSRRSSVSVNAPMPNNPPKAPGTQNRVSQPTQPRPPSPPAMPIPPPPPPDMPVASTSHRTPIEKAPSMDDKVNVWNQRIRRVHL